jgi:predicted AAA+ superfamily ATPase
MAITNRERVGKGLDLLRDGLKPYVVRELEKNYGEKWQSCVQEITQGKNLLDSWDIQILLQIMWKQWNEVFTDTLGHSERSMVSELITARNKWAHQDNFSTDDVYRSLDSMARLLTAVSAPEAEQIEQLKMEILRIKFNEQRRSETRKITSSSIEGQVIPGLRPWREVITPHPDVASGKFIQAEFAADLWQVYQKEAAVEYKDPVEFYRRTFLTDGLQVLLKGAIKRLKGDISDPVIDLQTNFGGGKTHSMLALYHLFSGVRPADLPGMEPLLQELEITKMPEVNRAVIVGQRLSPGQVQKKKDGTSVHTLWGEMAWQLGGKEGYELVRESDEHGTSPGEALQTLLKKYSPCLILIDEWVAYARQLYRNTNLPAGSFETQFTFAQILSETVKSVPQALLVVSIPVSDNEIGGEGGKVALNSLKNAIGRVGHPWKPASTEEGFEIVRRRLFNPVTDYVSRDAVVHAFSEMYRSHGNEFPSECQEASYERRIEAAYPIHPELFDRLFNDWSTLDRFQRTRGVLRLMASVISNLWSSNDKNLLIMPCNIPIDDNSVRDELTRYLEDQWAAVIENDVDGGNSLPIKLDKENPNFGRYSSCRRIARTLFVGTAPTFRAANHGLDDRHIKLGCAQPGETIATFGDALRRLSNDATYLYVDNRRYWLSTQPSVNRLADDRAAQLKHEDALEEIKKFIREELEPKGDFYRIHTFPGASGDIPDEQDIRLVVLNPESSHSAKEHNSLAMQVSQDILENRGTSPRLYKNTLIFLACDKAKISDLEEAVRQYVAWDSILRDKESLNLDAFQTRQAESKIKDTKETIKIRIPEVCQWLLVPSQAKDNPQVKWEEYRLQERDKLAVRACKKLKNEELLFTQMAGVRLALEIDKIPLWRGNHVHIRQLWDDFTTYLYLPKFRDENILLSAIQDGVSLISWDSETFAYADGYDEAKNRYIGLRAGINISINMDKESVLVKKESAQAQIKEELKRASEATATGGEAVIAGTGSEGETETTEPQIPKEKPAPRRFHGTITLEPSRMARDAGVIAQEIVQHLLSQPDSNVQITLEIQTHIPEGASDGLVRTVTENCRTLNFDNYGFEDK